MSVAPAPTQVQSQLNIRLPENAHLWVEGKEISKPGTAYQLTSPPLDSGYNYTYHLKAQWNEGNAQMTRTRAVHIRAGQQVNVDLTTEGMDETTVRLAGAQAPR
jgi:uncharacterized protein (TIGR03000 family)